MDEFEKLGRELLKHKYLYYVEARPEITDAEYDDLEYKYTNMAKAMENEPDVHLVAGWDDLNWCLRNCTMTGFPETHPWAKEVLDASWVKE